VLYSSIHYTVLYKAHSLYWPRGLKFSLGICIQHQASFNICAYSAVSCTTCSSSDISSLVKVYEETKGAWLWIGRSCVIIACLSMRITVLYCVLHVWRINWFDLIWCYFQRRPTSTRHITCTSRTADQESWSGPGWTSMPSVMGRFFQFIAWVEFYSNVAVFKTIHLLSQCPTLL